VSEIDVGRLADWMDGAALPGKGEPLEARFLSGGTQNVIYELRRGDERCVLRMPPPGAPPDRDKGILREWRIIEALDGTEVPHTKSGRTPASRSARAMPTSASSSERTAELTSITDGSTTASATPCAVPSSALSVWASA